MTTITVLRRDKVSLNFRGVPLEFYITHNFDELHLSIGIVVNGFLNSERALNVENLTAYARSKDSAIVCMTDEERLKFGKYVC